MKDDTGLNEASRQYSTAQAAQYETKDLQEALDLYQRIVAAHPDSSEAGYSRSQIHNIVKKVVPENELLEAQVSMAVAHLGGERRQESGTPVAPVPEARP